MSERPDVIVTDEGTIWTFQLLSPPAREWVELNVEVPDYMRQPQGFAADWRPARDIVAGMNDAGLTVRAR